ncbi:hypothetical protein L9F63_016457, partial [Diploptera punctata]
TPNVRLKSGMQYLRRNRTQFNNLDFFSQKSVTTYARYIYCQVIVKGTIARATQHFTKEASKLNSCIKTQQLKCCLLQT